MNRASDRGNPPHLRNVAPEHVITLMLVFMGGIVMVIPFAYITLAIMSAPLSFCHRCSALCASLNTDDRILARAPQGHGKLTSLGKFGLLAT